MNIGGLLSNKKEAVKSHYKKVGDALFSNGVSNILKNLYGIYRPRNKLRKIQLLIDLFLLGLVLCLVIDINCLFIGNTLGSVCIDKTNMKPEEGFIPVKDEEVLSQTYDVCMVRSGLDGLDVDVDWTLYTQFEDIDYDTEYNLSKYSLPYFIKIDKIFYCKEDWDISDPELSTHGNVDIKNILVVGSLINCSKRIRYGSESDMCDAYPVVLTPDTSFIAPNDEFILDIASVSFDYDIQYPSGHKKIRRDNIRLNYILTRKVDRQPFESTITYITVIPRGIILVVEPSIINAYDWIKSTFEGEDWI